MAMNTTDKPATEDQRPAVTDLLNGVPPKCRGVDTLLADLKVIYPGAFASLTKGADLPRVIDRDPIAYGLLRLYVIECHFDHLDHLFQISREDRERIRQISPLVTGAVKALIAQCKPAPTTQTKLFDQLTRRI